MAPTRATKHGHNRSLPDPASDFRPRGSTSTLVLVIFLMLIWLVHNIRPICVRRAYTYVCVE